MLNPERLHVAKDADDRPLSALGAMITLPYNLLVNLLDLCQSFLVCGYLHSKYVLCEKLFEKNRCGKKLENNCLVTVSNFPLSFIVKYREKISFER